MADGVENRAISDYSDSDSEEESDSDDSSTTLGEAQSKRSKANPIKAKDTVRWNPQSILGSSSAQPLRMLSQNNVERKKNIIHRFVGDRQPATELGMASLFGAHPQPISTTVNSVHEEEANDEADTALPAHVRTYYEHHDESLHLAGTDVEAPPAELLEYIKTLAVAKVSRHGVSTEATEHKEDFTRLENKFDPSALVALGILIEELVRDMIINWYKRGSALDFDPRALRTEALAQMNGAASRGVTFLMLKNQLEVSRRIVYVFFRITLGSVIVLALTSCLLTSFIS